jgi:hypothetical protein
LQGAYAIQGSVACAERFAGASCISVREVWASGQLANILKNSRTARAKLDKEACNRIQGAIAPTPTHSHLKQEVQWQGNRKHFHRVDVG